MSQPINIYTSAGVDQNINGFLASMGHNLGQVVFVKPLSLLPAPDPVRRQVLRTERMEVLESIKQAEFCLEQYASGAWQPDLSCQEGTRFDLDALRARLRGIEAVLGTEKGGPDNA